MVYSKYALSDSLVSVNRCHYCTVSYDAIGHLETFRDDLAYILTRTGLADTAIPLDKVLKEKKNTCQHEPNRLQKYMAQLNQRQREALYEIYGVDFEKFGYDPNV